MINDKEPYIQNIYEDNKSSRIWTLSELKSQYTKDDSINNYYLENDEAWIFTETTEKNLLGEKWRKCKSSEKICPDYEIFASNFGRIKIHHINNKTKEKICELYDELNTKEPICAKLFKTLHTKQNVGYLKAKNPETNLFLMFNVHRLVADAWLQDYDLFNPEHIEVHHITNDGYDNCPENLILLPQSQHKFITYRDKKTNPNYRPRAIKNYK